MSADISTWSLQDRVAPDWEWLACADVLFSWPLDCAPPWFGVRRGPPSLIRSEQQIPRFLGLWVDPLPLQAPILILPLGDPLSVCATGYEKKRKNEKAGCSAERSMGAFGKAESLISRLSLSPSSSSQSQGEEGGEHPEHADQRASAVGHQAGDGERRQARHHRRGMPAAGARRAQQVRGRGSLSVGDPGFQDPFSA